MKGEAGVDVFGLADVVSAGDKAAKYVSVADYTRIFLVGAGGFESRSARSERGEADAHFAGGTRIRVPTKEFASRFAAWCELLSGRDPRPPNSMIWAISGRR